MTTMMVKKEVAHIDETMDANISTTLFQRTPFMEYDSYLF